jgi:hypothetical protein
MSDDEVRPGDEGLTVELRLHRNGELVHHALYESVEEAASAAAAWEDVNVSVEVRDLSQASGEEGASDVAENDVAERYPHEAGDP